jgi:hypothetical protein
VDPAVKVGAAACPERHRGSGPRTRFTLLNALFDSVVGEAPGTKPLLALPVKRRGRADETTAGALPALRQER